jgi:hypothetical protein
MKNEDDHSVKIETFETHRVRFYALAGYYVTHYQALEDSLAVVFASALRCDQQKALAIFACIRGLEAKLNVIAAALLNEEKILQELWQELTKLIKASSDKRHDIAHGSPEAASVVHITKRADAPRVPFRIKSGEPARMKLRKNKKIMTEEWLQAECANIRALSKKINDFETQLNGTQALERHTKS